MFVLACDEVRQMCYDMKPILVVVKYIILILQWSVPLILLVWGSIDIFKAIAKADDSKVVEDAKKSFIKRLVYGAIIFVVPFVVRLILGLVEDNMLKDNDEFSPTSWIGCWQNIDDANYFSDCDDIFKKKESNKNKNYDEINGSTTEASNNYCYVYYEPNVQINCPKDSSSSGIVDGAAKCALAVTYTRDEDVASLGGYIYKYGCGLNGLFCKLEDGESYTGSTKDICEYAVKDAYNDATYLGVSSQKTKTSFSCYFKYGNRLQESVSSTQPSRTYDGKYERYSCPSTFSSCSSAETVKNHCTPA